MSSRDSILNALAKAQPSYVSLPDISGFVYSDTDIIDTYTTVLTGIGGIVIDVSEMHDIKNYIQQKTTANSRIVTTIPALGDFAEVAEPDLDPHSFQDVDYAIIEAKLGVAENGAVWVTEGMAVHRVLPFICQHLLVLLNVANIVPTMHEAYKKIGDSSYGYGAFIAGPSKTADIEQSLVLGAHGPRSMTICLMHPIK